jgi:membrane protein
LAGRTDKQVAVTTSAQAERQRIRRILTFWLRPGFVLRTLTRFQRVAGFDRAIALASTALTALIPLAVVVGGILPNADGSAAANSIIARYGLTGGGADAVRKVLSPPDGTSTDISLVSLFLVVIAALSFSRSAQRLFEHAWELKPLSVRNTLNDLIWIGGLVAYIAFSWWIRSIVDSGHVEIAANLALIPVSAIFLAWSGRILSARRLEWRSLAPFAILGAVLLAIYFTVASIYVPHLFSVYASRYGAIGAVLAMISWLFAVMLVLVASAALGREVFEELGRIRRGERPPEDEVRREWNAAVDEARSRWEAGREWIDRFRRRGRRE